MLCRSNSLYLINRWVVLLHCALVIVSMFALGLPAVQRAPAAVFFGFLAFACFGFTEMLRTAISIFAINRNWRAVYASAVDPATRERFRAFIEAYSGVNDALFFIFLYHIHRRADLIWNRISAHEMAACRNLESSLRCGPCLTCRAGSTPSLF